MAQASHAIQKYPTEQEISKYIKCYLDTKYSPNWHCIVGKHFAHFGSYEVGSYIFFHVGQVAILLYRMI